MKIEITLDSVVSPSYLNLLVATEKRSEQLSKDRRDQWLSKINRKNWNVCQIAEQNSALHVCRKHFINGKPYETTDSGCIPAINLGYELMTIFSRVYSC